MTEKIHDNRQLYKAVDNGNVVNTVKHILKDRFHSAMAMQVMELEVSQKYMGTKPYVSTLNINLNQQMTPPTTQQEHQQRHMSVLPAPARVKTNALTIEEKSYSCGRWQEYKYPCRYAMLTSENGKRWYFLIFSRSMCMTITRTKACYKYMDVIVFL